MRDLCRAAEFPPARHYPVYFSPSFAENGSYCGPAGVVRISHGKDAGRGLGELRVTIIITVWEAQTDSKPQD